MLPVSFTLPCWEGFPNKLCLPVDDPNPSASVHFGPLSSPFHCIRRFVFALIAPEFEREWTRLTHIISKTPISSPYFPRSNTVLTYEWFRALLIKIKYKIAVGDRRLVCCCFSAEWAILFQVEAELLLPAECFLHSYHTRRFPFGWTRTSGLWKAKRCINDREDQDRETRSGVLVDWANCTLHTWS